MGDSTILALEEKLETLARSHDQYRKRMRTALGAISFGLIAVVVLSGAAFQNAGRFKNAAEIVDGKGQLRAVIYADNSKNQSGVDIKDPKGANRFSLRTRQGHDASLHFIDANGTKRIDIGVDAKGAFVRVFKANGVLHHSIEAP